MFEFLGYIPVENLWPRNIQHQLKKITFQLIKNLQCFNHLFIAVRVIFLSDWVQLQGISRINIFYFDWYHICHGIHVVCSEKNHQFKIESLNFRIWLKKVCKIVSVIMAFGISLYLCMFSGCKIALVKSIYEETRRKNYEFSKWFHRILLVVYFLCGFAFFDCNFRIFVWVFRRTSRSFGIPSLVY